MVNQLREIKGYQKIVVPATAFTNEELLENIKNSGRPLNDKGEFSLEQLVSYAAQEPVQQQQPQLPNIEQYKNTERLAEGDVVTPITRKIGGAYRGVMNVIGDVTDKINQAPSNVEERRLRELKNSYIEEGVSSGLTRPEATVRAEDMLSGNSSPPK